MAEYPLTQILHRCRRRALPRRRPLHTARLLLVPYRQLCRLLRPLHSKAPLHGLSPHPRYQPVKHLAICNDLPTYLDLDYTCHYQYACMHQMYLHGTAHGPV